ncbi:bis(5'-nucleosyl)-tetraphosphatase (symmetrical) YqeK [Peptostreptococcus canis]|uniref:bis(5'-nucleosyl)-tetraphosphatase (symmetrical) n=1 Tax=Peptostreptococcus canis TaxID=1159213 RepID=A0ABR6TM65_9FIRM|nr:bis(5'-nucleosyl)-tetraphosphatase (symmetrical) YqeK [Peptostreptococcus canis]MBC2576071.1 HD domain-containing protein [Peptostreptococcus canis]MBP1997803.1 putative HD superfamily hydrolase involved in NAD metabolism [Peptostreptococcus canis]
MKKSEMIEKLSEYLPEKRKIHSLNVAKAAVRLSEIYGCDPEKAEIAGILHDTAKYVKLADVPGYCEKYNIILDEMEKNSTALSHSVLGTYIAKYEFGIKDEEILSAIRYHTTAKPNMSLLEKVVYIADLIEIGRDYPGVEELRELAYGGFLDEAIVKSIDNTISQVLKKKSLLHLRTVESRNYYLKKIKNANKSI